jgi:hypothetical protein
MATVSIQNMCYRTFNSWALDVPRLQFPFLFPVRLFFI